MGPPDYLRHIGVRESPRATCPFDPGESPSSFLSHMEQSAHLMGSVKLSMATWLLADEGATRDKLRCARGHGVPTVAGGSPFEIAVAQGALGAYLGLCAEMGFGRVEVGSGFTDMNLSPKTVAQEMQHAGLGFDYELGAKHDGPWGYHDMPRLIEVGDSWLCAGAGRLVIEARESAMNVGLFSPDGFLNPRPAEELAGVFGLDRLVFESPMKATSLCFLKVLGPDVQLGNVPLSEVLRVECMRAGLHSDAWLCEKLRPREP